MCIIVLSYTQISHAPVFNGFSNKMSLQSIVFEKILKILKLRSLQHVILTLRLYASHCFFLKCIKIVFLKIGNKKVNVKICYQIIAEYYARVEGLCKAI